MSATTPAATPSTPDAAGAPLEAARAALERRLLARHRDLPPGETLPEPRVVPLGAADTLGAGHPDPHAEARPAATVHLTARAVLLGPWGTDTTAAPQTPPACGRCLAMRWQRLRSRSEREALELGEPPAGARAWPVLTPWVVDAVWSAYRAAAGVPAPARPADPTARPDAPDTRLRQVVRVDLATLATARFPLLPEPLCPHCVRPRPDTPEDARMRLRTAVKADPAGSRGRPADAYPLPTLALANPVCGALGSGTWLNPASTTTAPVAGSHFVRGYAGLNDVTWSGQADAYAASRTLAYLEGLERYAGTHRRRGTSPVERSFHDLRAAGLRVLDPRECGTYAPETYATDPLVSPFDPDRPIPWVWGHSLRDDEPVLVPARLVHYSAGVAADNFVFECSNGCATGGGLEEAVLFGLLELIERDAFLLAWYARPALTGIDLDSCRGTGIRSLRDRAALHGYDVRAYDTRMGNGVPVVTALAVRSDGGPGTLSFAAAAGFDPERTVGAALCEVLTYIPHLPGQVAERRDELEAMAEDFTRVRQLKDHAQLYGLPRMAEHATSFLEPEGLLPLAESFPGWQGVRRPGGADLLEELTLVRDDLVAAGHDVIAVDQTTPEQLRMGLRTVSTHVPGLLPLDFGWSRQRAPRMPRMLSGLRRAGRAERDLTPRELASAPHPFP
ncbi:TOMM precursor leader peptide-binding protein [Streptomyces chumphonensis]|uniref:TOMM precursor leader peptide-binding protein n=1 Tax=Streptomyces chumphonensis TaxID=1214925 RepID=UPI003D754D6B